MNMDITPMLKTLLLLSLSFLLVSCGSEEEKEPETKVLPSFYDLVINFTQPEQDLGVINIQPSSLVCRTTCTSNIAADTVIELKATAKTGAVFVEWGGDCTGADICQVTMSSAHTVTASFTEASFVLSIEITDGGSITLSDDLGECIEDCEFNFNGGKKVTLKAVPNTDNLFTGWTGGCTGNSSCYLTMSEAQLVTATFEKETAYTLSTEVSIGGAISFQDGTLECIDSCSFNLIQDELIEVIATPEYGYIFKEWLGDCTGTEKCEVTIDGAKTVTANFEKLPIFALSTSVSAGGSISLKDDALTCLAETDCSFELPENETVIVKPLPATGYIFTGWSGDCSGNSTCELTITAAQSIIANFIEIPEGELLTLSISTGGSIALADELGECFVDCQLSFNNAELLTLTATPEDGYTFSGWSDDCSGEAGCQVTMSTAHSVTATFTALPEGRILTLEVSAGGSVFLSENLGDCAIDCQLSFSQEENLTLTATPDLGYIFSGWSGDCISEANCQVIMSTDHSITALFTEIPPVTLTIQLYEGGSATITGDRGTCLTDCTLNFAEGTELTINPIPDDGYTFTGWSGACIGNSSCTLTMTKAEAITAIFKVASPSIATNTITITEPHGINHIDYPIQIGRPFVKGEISNYPQVMHSGVAIPTQADVKQRYNDGSVKHAIISFILPSLNANAIQTLSFVNKATSDNTPQTKAEMLTTPNFDAQMSFDFQTIKTVSAKDMISNDHFKYWLQGPIATTVIVADHSTNRAYDLGSDTFKSIRPIFQVTFWPQIDKYFVRYIAESINTEALQDQSYDLELSINQESSFYQKLTVPHQAKTRWTKKQWSGEQLKTLSINHNIAYLSSTKAIPNYDTSRVQSEASISSYWESWLNQEKDLYDKGYWQKAMATTGGRPDIGLYPSWAVKWLYTGDWRLYEIAMAQSELAAAWGIHLREGGTGRNFDFENTIDAMGKILSIAPNARPTHWIAKATWSEIKSADKVLYVGDHASSAWQADNAHHPDISSPQYLLTGDYFYLQEMLFSAAYVTSNNNAAGIKSTLGRGPTGSEGGLYSGQTRGQGWALRTRVHTYDILPDSFPEKAYFHRLNENAISMFEGLYALPLSNTSHQVLYDYTVTYVNASRFVAPGSASPIGNWETGVTAASYVKAAWVDTTNVNRAYAPWMQNFVIVALGRAKELGYDTDQLLGYAGLQLLAPFSDINLPHHMIFAYVTPSLDNNNQWFTSWTDLFSNFNPDYVTTLTDYAATNNDAQHGTPSIVMAAASFLPGNQYHPELWKYILDNVAIKDIYNNSPKWAILPREDN